MTREYNGFNIGMKVKILSCPGSWNSVLNYNCPFYLDYPYICIIKEIYFCLGGAVAMTDGNYGWSLSSLVDFNLIEIIDIKKERKRKLEEIVSK
jgi:hypothetical protein